MITKLQFTTVRLLDHRGLVVADCRVPLAPFKPPVIVWANRHFAIQPNEQYYAEVNCYLVPLEDMYAPSLEIDLTKGRK